VYREKVSAAGRRPILIADDDAVTLDGLTEFLAELGYRIAPARNGQEAMNLLTGGLVPSLFIVDLAMPQLGGDELLKYVQSDPELRFVPVLVVTGAPEKVGRTVADAVLEKPVNLAALLSQVQRLTAARSPHGRGRSPR
jgi:two-component system chemotaxis response regulator CheY